MKKIISLILVLIMVLGMGIEAFAENISGTVSGDQTWNNEDTVGTTSISGGTITVNGIVTVNGTITITGNVRITGGGKLLRGNSANTYMISVTSGSLTLDNITLDGNGDSYNGKGVYVNNDAKLTINEGAVLKNHKTTDRYGSVMRIEGQAVMNGGIIENNSNYNYGNIYLECSPSDPATFIMNGGIVRNNYLTISDGNYGGGAFYVRNAIFTMNGGTISGHHIDAKGGAIYCTSWGKVYLNGGVIDNNTSENLGDSIFYSSENTGDSEIYIGGNPLITNRIYLDNRNDTKYPYITSAIKNDLILEVNEYDESRPVAQGVSGYNMTKSDMTKVSIYVGTEKFYAKLVDNKLFMTRTNPGVNDPEYTEKFYVIYHGNLGTGETLDDTEYKIGDQVDVKENEFTREGYTFDSWNTEADGSGTRYNPGDEVNMTGDITLYAQWTPDTSASKTYTVTAETTPNGNLSVSAPEAEEGEEITITATPAEGYEVDTVKVEAVGATYEVTVTDNKFTMPAADVTVTVTFKPKTYTVTTALTENGTASVDKTTAAEGDVVTVTANPDEGYEVDTVKVEAVGATDEVTVTDNKFTMPAADVTVTVTFKPKTYTVTYVADGEIVEVQEVEHGKDAVAPEIPRKVGYDRTKPVWNHDGKNITADTTITADYTINKYLVTYIFLGKVVDEQWVEHGSDAVAPKLLLGAKWEHDGKNITDDIEIKAIFRSVSNRNEKPEDVAEENPNTGAPVFAPVAVLAAAAVVLGKKNK